MEYTVNFLRTLIAHIEQGIVRRNNPANRPGAHQISAADIIRARNDFRDRIRQRI